MGKTINSGYIKKTKNKTKNPNKGAYDVVLTLRSGVFILSDLKKKKEKLLFL